jgi:hypothetical protein
LQAPPICLAFTTGFTSGVMLMKQNDLIPVYPDANGQPAYNNMPFVRFSDILRYIGRKKFTHGAIERAFYLNYVRHNGYSNLGNSWIADTSNSTRHYENDDYFLTQCGVIEVVNNMNIPKYKKNEVFELLGLTN